MPLIFVHARITKLSRIQVTLPNASNSEQSIIPCLLAAVEPTYHFKVLVPSMVAGAIIGKGGETIAQLQKDTGARVKMSKSHDFYPGEYTLLYLNNLSI